MSTFIKALTLKNLLSFGPEAEVITLRPLNVVIGPNGSGKSNLLAAINLLRHAPEKFAQPVRRGGGIQEWLWKGKEKYPIAEISVDMAFPPLDEDDPTDCYEYQYSISFHEENASLVIQNETIDGKYIDYTGPDDPPYKDEQPFKHIDRLFSPPWPPDSKVRPQRDESILSAVRGSAGYPSIDLLAKFFSEIALYREWVFGAANPARQHQRADMPNDRLEADASNLGLVLNRLRQNPDAKKRLVNALNDLYAGIDDVDVSISSGDVQVFLQEDNRIIPATRLSDGTLRYLFLLAILCDPDPPRLVCIEEPELGLHPDVLPTLAELLREASQRCQLIVTTHSDVLIDALTNTPEDAEDVLVCERDPEKGTTFRRLDAAELKPWLEEYSLGRLWRRGDIGGTRW